MKTITVIAVLSLFSISTLSLRATNIAQWTFETSQPATAGPIGPEIGNGMASGSHVGTASYSAPSGNGSLHSFSANTWAAGDYWQFQVSTLTYKDIQVSFDQYGSKTGPRDFSLEYSTDGANFTSYASYSIGTASSWLSSSFDLTSVTSLDNKPTVYFRLVDNSTTPIDTKDYSAVESGGTDRIDNFTVSGNSMPMNIPDSLPPALAAVAFVGVLILSGRRAERLSIKCRQI